VILVELGLGVGLVGAGLEVRLVGAGLGVELDKSELVGAG